MQYTSLAEFHGFVWIKTLRNCFTCVFVNDTFPCKLKQMATDFMEYLFVWTRHLVPGCWLDVWCLTLVFLPERSCRFFFWFFFRFGGCCSDLIVHTRTCHIWTAYKHKTKWHIFKSYFGIILWARPPASQPSQPSQPSPPASQPPSPPASQPHPPSQHPPDGQRPGGRAAT